MSIEAMKQALEALERSVATCFDQYAHQQAMSRPDHFINQAITSLRQAIAEAEKQEPVAWIYPATDVIVRDFRINPKDVVCLPLYTHPQPKREWVGLTVMETVELDMATNHPREFAATIEAKLKSKNGF